jgi:hypothetical protein
MTKFAAFVLGVRECRSDVTAHLERHAGAYEAGRRLARRVLRYPY